MTLSRWRRLATGIAAGVLVLVAALLGASFRSDSNGVSVASDLRPTDAIPIPVDTDDAVDTDDSDATDEVVTTDVDGDDDAVEVTEADDADVSAEPTDDTEDTEETDDTDDTGEANATADGAEPTDDTEDTGEANATADGASSDNEGDDSAPAANPPADPTPTPVPPPPAPAPPTSSGLGTGGGVDDAECGLDRLVIYAGAPVGGVAGRLRAALAQNGFGAGCPSPVTVLASNCPQQFSGVLGTGSGYDPARPYVAASGSVDRDTMIAIVSATGYSGSTIDILDFGFVNADRPGEQWVAIFVPPSFSGWESLAGQAGLAPSGQSLCGASGELGR